MNTINSVDNLSFSGRYLSIEHMEKIPPRISEAIYKSPAIDEFLRAGKPKTLWGKFIDLFKEDEMLDVYHTITKFAGNPDSHAQKETLSFEFDRKNYPKRTFKIRHFQKGILRQSGSIPKPNEDKLFKKPLVTSEDKIIKSIEEIKDFDSLLK